jgi:hypothetical protein
MTFKEKIVGVFLVLIIGTFIYLAEKDRLKIETSISKNKYETICRVSKIISRRSFTHTYYIYYYQGIEHESYDNIDVNEQDYLNKYFKMNLSTENPAYSKIFIDEEITDSNLILKAGFNVN